MARKKKQTTDPPPESLENTDDTFGLPEVDYQPLKRDETEEPIQDEPVKSEPEVVVINEVHAVTPEPPPPVETPAFEEAVHEESPNEDVFNERNKYEEVHQPYTSAYNYDDESPSVWPKVVGALLVLALVGLAIWYFASYRPAQLAKQEQERKELLAIQEEARKKEDDRLAALKREEEEKKAAELPPPAPSVGAIETLTGRSGRYYAVVASSIDGDLIMDYAKKLSAKGVSTKIIPPFGKSSFHRLAVADGDTYQTTQTTADGLKGGDYGDKVWVVKY